LSATAVLDYTHSQLPQPHPQRARDIMQRHPEVRTLFGRNPWTAVFVFLLVGIQVGAAYLASSQLGWIWVAVLAYALGAFVNHALFVLNHECAHNLILRGTVPNYLLGILGDVALAFPSAITFRRYHLLHHAHQGEYELDADIAGRREARIVGYSTWRKTVWLACLGVMQALRPLRVKAANVRDQWVLLNFVVIAAVDVTLVVVWGPKALVYLMLSTFFALGLHPVGGRWIQEHIETEPGQETYSYYGPLNKTCFNVGYHNEHHDFAGVAWNRLPRLRAMAAETYDPLASYQSWSGLVGRFLTDNSLGPYSRVLRG
jgi:sphingolipid delta-4 desaturase